MRRLILFELPNLSLDMRLVLKGDLKQEIIIKLGIIMLTDLAVISIYKTVMR